MVKYNDRIRMCQKLRTLRITRPVRIHNHDQRIAADHLKRLITVDKHIFRIAFLRRKAFHQRTDRAGRLIDHDLRFLSKHSRRTENSNSGTERIDICKRMSHNNNILAALNDLMQCMCLNSRLNSGITFHLFGFTTKVCDIFAIFDNDLITASSKCKIDRSTRLLVTLIIRRSLNTDSDTQRDRHLISDLHRLDILKDTETIVHHRLQIFIFKYNKILILLNLADQSIHLREVLVYLTIHQSNQKRSLNIFDTVKRLIVIVNIDQPRNLLLLSVLLLITVQFRLIKQIQCGQKFLGLIHLDRLTLIHDIVKIDTVQRYTEFSVLHLQMHILRSLMLL